MAGAMLILILSLAILHFILRYRSNHISKRERDQEKEKHCKIRYLVFEIILSFFLAQPDRVQSGKRK